MDIGIVSMRYARAWFEYVKAAGVEDRIYKEVSMLIHSLRKHPELRKAFENPILSKKEKLSLICIATVGSDAVSEEFRRFIVLALKNRRENILPYIFLTFLRLYRNSKHIGVARLVTAVPISKEVEERIRKSASTVLHAHMELRTEVDPAIEGGFIFDINDYRLDASIATQLKRVEQQFIDKNRRIV